MLIASTQSEEDFTKAHNKAFFNEIQHFLNPEEATLLSLNDVKQLIKPKNETYIGMKTIEVSKVVGSEGRYNDFDNRFFPKNSHLRNRWQHVDEAAINSVVLPPIKVYELAGLYFVRDGNHRVSVAKARGTEFIDAEVVSLQSEVVLKRPDNLKDVIRQIINYEKRSFYAETAFGDITDYWCLDFSTTGCYDVIYNHILTHKYYLNLHKTEEVSLESAIISWFETVYVPVVVTIQKQKLMKSFKKQTISDLYVWIVRYWDDLKSKFGDDNISIDDAVSDFSRKNRLSLYRKFMNWLNRIIIKHQQ
jgi:hypothetical protein